MPFLALGGLLVIVCVLACAYGAVRLGDRIQVLAVARPIAAGQVFTAVDLRQVSAAQDPSVPLMSAEQASQVVGRTAVVPLLPGTLLTPSVVGDAAFPPAGKVTASVAVKPGQYPQGLAAGATVAVYVSSADTASGSGEPSSSASSVGRGPSPVRLTAAVLGVDLGGDGQGSTVVTLQLDSADAGWLAAAPAGGVVLMQTSPEDK
jgi:hypothetical protein